MSGDFKSRYRVDEVPWYWWPWLQIYGWSIGTLVFLYSAFVALTSRVYYEGFPLQPDKNYVFCFWHQQVFAFHCLTVRLRNWASFVHPLWYMKPTHVIVGLKGARHIVLGSSGNRGVDAANQLALLVQQGCSTFFNPDGPYGPVGHVQKGALHVAIKSATPVVGMALQSSRYIELNGWDRKQIPLPFSRFTVYYGESFLPDADDMETAARRLAQDMSFYGDL
jgi:lysophospholipid acyltransferase (LPLAT)-like uncharacterized protein